MNNHLRLFGRPAKAPATTPDERPEPETADAPDGMPVVDRAGTAFETARHSALGVGLFRVDSVEDLPRLAADTVVLYAAHDQAELERGYALMRRQPTVVMGIGLGAESGSRALNLGAIGYIHDGLDRSQLSGAFGDALTRLRYRTVRATGSLALSA